MVRKVKKKKSGMRIFVTFLLMVGIAAFVYITQGKYHIFEVPPLIEPDLSVEANPTSPTAALPGQFSVTFPDQGESAVGTDNFGVIASTPNQTPVPIASVTKIMTAYLVLKAHPLQPGEGGPILTMNAQDVSDYQNDLSNGYSVLKVTCSKADTIIGTSAGSSSSFSFHSPSRMNNPCFA